MNKSVRFIKTKVDEEELYMIMTKCNLCPYMICQVERNQTICGHPWRKSSVLALRKNATFIQDGEKNILVENCYIPNHCPLSNDLKKEFDAGTLKYKLDNKIYTKCSPRLGDEKILFEVYMNFKEKSDLLTFSDKFKSYTTNKQLYDDKTKKDSEYVPYTPIIINEICSCCGERKEEVIRNEKNGVCGGCFEKMILDSNIKYNSFVNNFRLKRNKTYENKNFKKVSIIF